MSAPAPLDPEDVLAAIDATLLNLSVLRRMVERSMGDGVPADGDCAHLERQELDDGEYCVSCGTRIPGDGGHGVSSTPTDGD